jgi:dCTP diphosphatase
VSNHENLSRVIGRLREFVTKREWNQFHDPKNLSMAIASEAGELLSELRWVTTAESETVLDDPQRREKVENEIADIAIALLLFCERTGIDLIAAIDRKIDLNELNYPVAGAKGSAERPSA